jgi:hydroxyacylglutathione hydrolase
MKVFFHFAVNCFSNTYLIGPEGPGDAILVDPGILDSALLRLIEDHRYYVRSILVTHAHESHVHGIKTLLKIYEAEIYASTHRVLECPCTIVADGQTLEISGFRVQTIGVPGHSSDSIAYRIGDMLFTGDTLAAGTIGPTPNGYARALLIQNIKEKLLTLPESLTVLPGHGPPSSIAVERLSNPALREKL